MKKITVIVGDSGTGKTTFVNLIDDANKIGADTPNPIKVVCNVSIRHIFGEYWKPQIESLSQCILVFDEDEVFIGLEEFARVVESSDNYFLIMSRRPLTDLSYDDTEIYEFYSDKKSDNPKKVCNKLRAVMKNE